MAALITRAVVFARITHGFNCENPRKYAATLAKYLKKKKLDNIRKPGPMVYSMKDKISAKGYLRSQKSYTPPENVDKQLNAIFSAVEVNCDPNFVISDPLMRFKILDECFKSFQHGVPNSLLHTMNKIGDIVEFYKTPVDTATPMDRYQSMDLPPNLSIQFEYKRFHPDDDTMFNGVSAFPKSGTIISGLKAKKKYKSVPPQNWTKDWRELGLGYLKW